MSERTEWEPASTDEEKEFMLRLSEMQNGGATNAQIQFIVLEELRKPQRQRDELLEACKLLVQWDDGGDAPEMLMDAVAAARKAIETNQ